MILSSFLILTLFGHFAVSHPVYSLLLLHHLVEHLDSYWYNPMLAFTPLYHKSCLSVQQTFSSSLPRSDIRHAPLLLRRQAARPIRAVHERGPFLEHTHRVKKTVQTLLWVIESGHEVLWRFSRCENSRGTVLYTGYTSTQWVVLKRRPRLL